MGDITGANSIFTLTVEGLYDAPQQLQGYATDDAFLFEEIEVGNPVMCLDGQLLGGITLVPIPQTIRLQADSPDNAIFDGWWQANLSAQTPYTADGNIIIPNLGGSWSLQGGLLVRLTPVPPVKKLVGPRRYTIAWASVTSG